MHRSNLKIGLIGFTLLAGLMLVLGPLTGRQASALGGGGNHGLDCVEIVIVVEFVSIGCDAGNGCTVACPAYAGVATVQIGDEVFDDVPVSFTMLGEPTVAQNGTIRHLGSHTFCFDGLGSFTTIDGIALVPDGGFHLVNGNLRVQRGTGIFDGTRGSRMVFEPGSLIFLPGDDCTDGSGVFEISGLLCLPGDPCDNGDADSDSSSDFDSDSGSDSNGDGDSDSSGDGDSDSSSDCDSDSGSDSNGDGDSDSSDDDGDSSEGDD